MKTINTEKITAWFEGFARKQLTISKDGKNMNIPAPAAALFAIFFGKLALVGCVAALLMGCKFSFGEKAAPAPAQAPAQTYDNPAQYVEQLSRMMYQ